MTAIHETSFLDLPQLTRDEKREIWMKRSRNPLSKLAEVAGLREPTLSKHLRSDSMPTKRREALVLYGVPVQCLPAGEDKTPGVKPKHRPSISE